MKVLRHRNATKMLTETKVMKLFTLYIDSAHADAKATVLKVVSSSFDSFTILPAESNSRGRTEPAWLVKLATNELQRVIEIASRIRALLNQDGVGIEYSGQYYRCTAANHAKELVEKVSKENIGTTSPHFSLHPVPTVHKVPSSPCVLPECELAGGMKLEKWRKIVGISRTAAWRLRKTGKLPVIVRHGQAYLKADTIKNFYVNDGSKVRSFAAMDSFAPRKK